MKDSVFFLAIAIAVYFGTAGLATGQDEGRKPVTKSSTTNFDDWELNCAKETPFRIAQIRTYYGETRLLIHLEPRYFTHEDLRRVFAFLSKKYPTVHSLWANLFSNKDVIADEITARSFGLWSWEDLPDAESRYKKADLGKNKYSFYRATYQRNIETEQYEINGPGEKDFERIIIRQR